MSSGSSALSNVNHHSLVNASVSSSAPNQMSKNKITGRSATILDPTRTPVPAAKWYDQERLMRIAGLALLVLASSALIVSGGFLIAGAVYGTLAAVSTIIAAITTVASLAGIYKGYSLRTQDYWRDQNFVDRITEKTHALSFDQIIQQYGWERVSTHHFISQEHLTQKFLDKVKRENLSYKSIIEKFGKAINQYHFIDWTALTPLLTNEVINRNMSIMEFKQFYGDQPLQDGVVNGKEPWYEKAIIKGIEGQTYAQIKQNFPEERRLGVISDGRIVGELKKQYAVQKTLEAFLVQQGGKEAFWNIFTDGIFEPAAYRNDAMTQLASTPISKIIEKFGWQIFATGMLQGSDLQTRLAQEEKDTEFSSLLAKYGWNVFNHGLAKSTDYKASLLKEITSFNLSKETFKKIITIFSWKIFSFNMISGEDLVIRKAFIQLAQNTHFEDLWRDYKDEIFLYKLLPEATLDFILKLNEQKEQSLNARTERDQKILRYYDLTIVQALEVKQASIVKAHAAIATIETQIKDTLTRYHTAKQRLDTQHADLSKQIAELKGKIQAGTLNTQTNISTAVATSTGGREIPGQRASQTGSLTPIEQLQQLTISFNGCCEAGRILGTEYAVNSRVLVSTLSAAREHAREVAISATIKHQQATIQAAKQRDAEQEASGNTYRLEIDNCRCLFRNHMLGIKI